MPLLMAGAIVGGHRIESLIGAGGMGEVYRAFDMRLNRKVAVKVMPAAALGDGEARQRFLREGRAVAALNHPNICTIHEIGQTDEQTFIVMELVEGPSLDDLIAKSGLPIGDVLRYGRQLADALAHAHDRGIIHRDLKPANIRIAADGTLKVLDFGLAKAVDERSDENTTNVTMPGTILGTAAYMSPEQAAGKAVDKRTDIWAFGVVVYQMLSGQSPFAGDSFATTVAAILTTEPDWTRVPSSMRRMLAACLEKDVRRRLRDAGDAWKLVEESTASTPRSSFSRAYLLIGIGSLALGVVLAWALRRPPPSPPTPVTRWSITLIEPGGGERGVALSRDGRLLAYTGRALPIRPIWVRPLDQTEGHPIPGTDGGRRPFFSPDGKWLAYVSRPGLGSLMKVSLSGGTPTRLCEAANFLGGAWGEDDRIILTTPEGLKRVLASGGPCETLTTTRAAGAGHRFPHILPGGKAVLFNIVGAATEEPQIAVLDLASGEQRVLEQRGKVPRYVASGHLLYARDTAVFAVPFDLRTLKATGPEFLAIDGVFVGNAETGMADYAVSDRGMLVYQTADVVHRTLAWVDRAGGNPVATAAPPREYGSVRLSPDGRRVATFLTVGGPGVQIVDLERGTLSQVSSLGSFAVWTPDGSRVVYSQMSGEVLSAPSDGSAQPQLLWQEPFVLVDSVAPDGGTVAYSARSSAEANAPSFIKLRPLGQTSATPGGLFSSASNHSEEDGQISPDGKWIAYVSNESGIKQVYVRSYPGGAKMPVSIDGGEEPRWSRNPQTLFFRNTVSKQLMMLDVPAAASSFGRPQALFPLSTSLWDVAPDGKRFLVVKDPETEENPATVQIVMNWFEELRQKTQSMR